MKVVMYLNQRTIKKQQKTTTEDYLEKEYGCIEWERYLHSQAGKYTPLINTSIACSFNQTVCAMIIYLLQEISRIICKIEIWNWCSNMHLFKGRRDGTHG